MQCLFHVSIITTSCGIDYTLSVELLTLTKHWCAEVGSDSNIEHSVNSMKAAKIYHLWVWKYITGQTCLSTTSFHKYLHIFIQLPDFWTKIYLLYVHHQRSSLGVTAIRNHNEECVYEWSHSPIHTSDHFCCKSSSIRFRSVFYDCIYSVFLREEQGAYVSSLLTYKEQNDHDDMKCLAFDGTFPPEKERVDHGERWWWVF